MVRLTAWAISLTVNSAALVRVCSICCWCNASREASRVAGRLTSCYSAANLPFSPCGRRWRVAPDEGWAAANSALQAMFPSPARWAPSPARGEGEAELLAKVGDHYARIADRIGWT